MSDSAFANAIRQGLPDTLPAAPPPAEEGVDRAPIRNHTLTSREQHLALANALRYLPRAWHEEMAPELARELAEDGHIYMRRLRPAYAMHARPLGTYPARSKQAAAIMLMIQNNLDRAVAQHPYELVTYGGNGAVFSNWAQYLQTMRYLSEMTDEQTLVLYSGHPLGLFPAHKDAPRVVVTNGMMIPEHSTQADLDNGNALGVTQYGQMTAGSFMYIGPQGIVHGTTITLLNAARLYLGATGDDVLAGRVFVTSGLGGMSGAQAKAAVIAGAIGVVAEVNPVALHKRHAQGWVQEVTDDVDAVLRRVETARTKKEALSLGYLGNIVDLWERFVSAGVPIELGSDQTSLHNPFGGGYYPAGVSFEDARDVMHRDPAGFKEQVQGSLRRHVAAVNTLSDRGMHFWDYGNAFLVQARDAGADVDDPTGERDFRYPSYVEDIMGPMCFDYGFGPFRWVCTSCDPDDLRRTDRIAADVIRQQAAEAPDDIRQQMLDNLRWIEQADANGMVVGSQARILYADHAGRRRIAAAFNRAIEDGTLSAPVVLGRDHHDVSGTDSPWRETANIRDGSRICADMAVHNVIGDAMRGATWVSLHNGGGVGWGRVTNGGFGLLLDGSADAARRAESMLDWDVANGLARRAWARNEGAVFASKRAMEENGALKVTLPVAADPDLLRRALDGAKTP
ncbi:MAG: urocanate hydratase [Deltaproteobacteria bacterium]|nr:urocanate hydratase [Deltaproteobacteria bacterium]